MTAPPRPGRRAALRLACRFCLGWLGLPACTSLSAQAQSAVPPSSAQGEMPTARFARPAIDTDEGGLWSLMDREEMRLRRSPYVVRDPKLTHYLHEMVCRLGGDHCADIRVHVVRTPLFNASMAPNGMMQIWSGLLLRIQNEAQLAAIMGHELGHYLERHTIERLRDLKSRAAFAQFIGLFGIVGAVGQLGVLASAFAFSREQESRADRLGMQLMQRAGYDGRQAAQVWDNLLAELKITGGEEVGKGSPMMATHPPAESRRDDLLKLAGDAAGTLGSTPWREVVAAHRLGWLQDEVRRGQFEESILLFGRLLQQDQDDAQVLFARGEAYRQRAIQDDVGMALVDLARASQLQDAPAEVFRSLGLVHRQRDDKAAAMTSFEKYLGLAPDAADAGLIRHYLVELNR